MSTKSRLAPVLEVQCAKDLSENCTVNTCCLWVYFKSTFAAFVRQKWLAMYKVEVSAVGTPLIGPQVTLLRLLEHLHSLHSMHFRCPPKGQNRAGLQGVPFSLLVLMDPLLFFLPISLAQNWQIS